MIDEKMLAFCEMLTMAGVPFACIDTPPTQAAFHLDMNRFRSANDPVGNFPPQERA
jgi:hypothetical protein